jgi:A/G-specific adenine glycosylase
MKKKFSNFSKTLLSWSKTDNKRKMPWKGEKNPYKIWLSEIILQQTKVEQGLSYYLKFITAYPTIDVLAAAAENDVFKMWEGLGYYSRCRNLIATAKNITENYAGVFPEGYSQLLNLKGIGPYTAAAIASFAYNLPHAVVDGNVYRVLARYFGISIAIDSKAGIVQFKTLAHDLLDKTNPAAYNQAIMDFGATICKPKLPLCAVCVFKKTCAAFKTKQVSELPIKESRIIKKKRYFYFILAKFGSQIYIRKRTQKDIWQNLWEFISVELHTKIEVEIFLKSDLYKEIIPSNALVKNYSPFYKQQLTHQIIDGSFIVVEIKKPLLNSNYELVKIKDLQKFPFPRFITNYFEKNPTI